MKKPKKPLLTKEEYTIPKKIQVESGKRLLQKQLEAAIKAMRQNLA